MANLIILGLAFISLIVNTIADPVFLLSSKKINDISRSLFFDTDSFNNLMNEKLLVKESLPDIFLFNIKVNNQKFVENPSLLLNEIGSQSTLQKHFAPSSNTFSSVYVKNALSPEFSEKFLKNIESAGDYELVQSGLNKFSFNQVEELKKNNNKNILSVATVPVSELKSLDTLFGQSYLKFVNKSKSNHLIVLKFTADSDNDIPQVLNKLELNERVLQADGQAPVVADAQPGTPTGAAAPKITVGDPTPIGISSAGFTGYVISIILLIGVYIGFQVMQDIKGPVRFYKDNLQIGKEQ